MLLISVNKLIAFAAKLPLFFITLQFSIKTPNNNES